MPQMRYPCLQQVDGSAQSGYKRSCSQDQSLSKESQDCTSRGKTDEPALRIELEELQL